MNLSDNVTRDMLADVIEQALEDIEAHRSEARAAYEADNSDSFHMNMDIMFGLAIDVFRSRLSTLCEDECNENRNSKGS
ncbi:hypothetical protein SELR_pSRC200510 (plasmid) [Selenomonas ruminantium subsp. lactilytica TAM6421]|uniref:Uncharacterized protein n=1 Tax=Selenomonas ruminantium subsp. lactilytica (strain NBRC 103574 / TAM6421) TaxID=927704 RepID=I0GUZ8_SELRL|nr:hypothetical protein [Selenomonas ruminantium]BAL84585.1 hypothetical protein SELR_pSRC200510 [Selenomonas ruminantium subsp. lactilytica TAM6421]